MVDLADWQHHVGGVTFGKGTPYRIERWAGLGAADQRLGDADNPVADGAFAGTDYLGPRTWEWTIHIVAEDGTAARAMELYQALATAWSYRGRRTVNALTPYQFKMPGRQQLVSYGRPRRFVPNTTMMVHGMIDVECDFYAHDPLLYAPLAETLDLHLGDPPGYGVTVPLEVPLALSPGSGGPSGIIDNPGDADSWPTITIDDGTTPLLGPRLINDTTGKRMSFTSLTIPAGGTLTIVTKPGSRSIILNGGNAWHYLDTGTDPFPIVPGQNLLRFQARNFDSSVTATVRAYPAWDV